MKTRRYLAAQVAELQERLAAANADTRKGLRAKVAQVTAQAAAEAKRQSEEISRLLNEVYSLRIRVAELEAAQAARQEAA